MTWLKLIAMLVELTLSLSKAVADAKLVREGELRGATETMELTRERLLAAQAARSAGTPPSGGVRDPRLRD